MKRQGGQGGCGVVWPRRRGMNIEARVGMVVVGVWGV